MDLKEQLEAYGRTVKAFYNKVVTPWTVDNRDPLVGSFDQHNAHEDYDQFLFKNVPEGGIALDFGCGVGRNIVRFWKRFDSIDGVDISDGALIKAQLWIDHNNRSLPYCFFFSNDSIR